MRPRYLLIFVFVIFTSSLYSQDNYRALLYNGTGNGADHSRAVVLDNSGNIYVTGDSWGGSSSEDYVTIKYNQSGVQQWVARYNGTEGTTDIAYAIAVDNLGNVYVTGVSQGNGSLDCGTPDYLTIKYNANGVQQWIKRYDNGSADIAYALFLDADANVYVTGSSQSSTSEDIVTIKYNTSGVQQWLKRYDGTSHGSDIGRAINVDRSGNVIVTGSSAATGAGMDYIIIKYNSTGVQQWAVRYNGPGNGDDIAYGIVTDNVGNPVVTGGSKGSNTNLDYATLKYSAGGTLLWTQRYNGSANDTDVARSITMDAYGGIYVTGYSKYASNNYDYATIKYEPDGTPTWTSTYNGPANGNDKAFDVKVTKRLCGTDDPTPCFSFDIYVTGQSQGTGTGYDYATLKYNVKGTLQWAKRYNSPQNSDDIPVCIGVRDGSDYVFVTGASNNDYCTIWYFPDPPGNGISNIPDKIELYQNYPNPFNPATKIEYALTGTSYVTLKIYDVVGNCVAILVDSYQGSGRYMSIWDAGSFSSGTYFSSLTVNGTRIETKKMLLIK